RLPGGRAGLVQERQVLRRRGAAGVEGQGLGEPPPGRRQVAGDGVQYRQVVAGQGPKRRIAARLLDRLVGLARLLVAPLLGKAQPIVVLRGRPLGRRLLFAVLLPLLSPGHGALLDSSRSYRLSARTSSRRRRQRVAMRSGDSSSRRAAPMRRVS